MVPVPSSPNRGMGMGRAPARAPIAPVRTPHRSGHAKGKRVVFVTPFQNAAKEEAEKHIRQGKMTEIKREQDDTGKWQYIVYVFE